MSRAQKVLCMVGCMGGMFTYHTMLGSWAFWVFFGGAVLGALLLIFHAPFMLIFTERPSRSS